jgi:hypothetical protein
LIIQKTSVSAAILGAGIDRHDLFFGLMCVAPFVVFDVGGDSDEEQQGRPPNEGCLSLR